MFSTPKEIAYKNGHGQQNDTADSVGGWQKDQANRSTYHDVDRRNDKKVEGPFSPQYGPVSRNKVKKREDN